MKIPQELLRQIDKNKAVLFVGAGLSQEAGLPGWPELLREMLVWAGKHGITLSDQDSRELQAYIEACDFLLVAEEMRDRLGKEHFRRYMTETFHRPELTPTDTHRILPHIPFSAVLTSNYDNLLETAYTVALGLTPRVFTQVETPELMAAHRDGKFYILKVHGTIDRIDTLVLSRQDYREVMLMKPAYRLFLINLLVSNTVLFLGFGLSDPDWLLLLDQLQAISQGYCGPHYALMETTSIGPLMCRRFEKDYGIQILPYTASTKSHSQQIKMFLAQLANEIKQVKAAHY